MRGMLGKYVSQVADRDGAWKEQGMKYWEAKTLKNNHKIIVTVQNPRPQICQQSCHTPQKRLLSAAEGVITHVKMQNHPFANEFAWSVFAFLRGSEQIQIIQGCV